MTTPTRTPGDRYLDNCGRTWTVAEHGGLTHEAPGGTLSRSWHSLDACAGPLQPAHEQPQPGDKYRDKDGGIWRVMSNGMVTDGGYVWSWNVFSERCAPIEKVDEDAPKLHKLVNEPRKFRPLPLFTDAQRDAIGAAADRVFPPLDEDDPCPDYYRFPGGVQAKDIARHLTGNAAQAVQYLARSSRLDGVIKDDPLGDLYKAADMIRDEIERLELAAHRNAA